MKQFQNYELLESYDGYDLTNGECVHITMFIIICTFFLGLISIKMVLFVGTVDQQTFSVLVGDFELYDLIDELPVHTDWLVVLELGQRSPGCLLG